MGLFRTSGGDGHLGGVGVRVARMRRMFCAYHLANAFAISSVSRSALLSRGGDLEGRLLGGDVDDFRLEALSGVLDRFRLFLFDDDGLAGTFSGCVLVEVVVVLLSIDFVDVGLFFFSSFDEVDVVVEVETVLVSGFAGCGSDIVATKERK